MFRLFGQVAAQLLVTLTFALPALSQNNDCCRHVGRIGTCVQRVRMGMTFDGFECYALPPHDQRRAMEVVGCKNYNMAAELFGASSCQVSLPGSDVSTCRVEGDACFLIEKRERVIHSKTQRFECVKGEGLLALTAAELAPQQIVRGNCQVADDTKTF